MGTLEDSEATRARIIEVAGLLFAEQGWKSATVRTIASLAKTHLSAVNYHFENKKKLYEAVLAEALTIPGEMANALQQKSNDPAMARQILIAIVEGYLATSKDKDQAWKSQLIMREFLEPSAAFKIAIERSARPVFEQFRELLGVAAGLCSTPSRIELNAFLLMTCMDSFASYSAVTKLLLPKLDQSLLGFKALAAELVDVFIAGSRSGVISPLLRPQAAKPTKKKAQKT